MKGCIFQHGDMKHVVFPWKEEIKCRGSAEEIKCSDADLCWGSGKDSLAYGICLQSIDFPRILLL